MEPAEKGIRDRERRFTKKGKFFQKTRFSKAKNDFFFARNSCFFFCVCVECVASVACFMVSVVSSGFSDVAL